MKFSLLLLYLSYRTKVKKSILILENIKIKFELTNIKYRKRKLTEYSENNSAGINLLVRVYNIW